MWRAFSAFSVNDIWGGMVQAHRTTTPGFQTCDVLRCVRLYTTEEFVARMPIVRMRQKGFEQSSKSQFTSRRLIFSKGVKIWKLSGLLIIFYIEGGKLILTKIMRGFGENISLEQTAMIILPILQELQCINFISSNYLEHFYNLTQNLQVISKAKINVS